MVVSICGSAARLLQGMGKEELEVGILFALFMSQAECCYFSPRPLWEVPWEQEREVSWWLNYPEGIQMCKVLFSALHSGLLLEQVKALALH